MGMSNERAVPTAEGLLAAVYGPAADFTHIVSTEEAFTSIAESRGPVALCGQRHTWDELVRGDAGAFCPRCFDAAATLGLVDSG